MKTKYNIIIRDSKDIYNNIELLTDDELVDQCRECLALCKTCLSDNPSDEKNSELVDYCTMRLGDLIDYTLALTDAAEARGLKLRKAAAITNLKNLQSRIDIESSKIEPFFNGSRIDWEILKNF